VKGSVVCISGASSGIGQSVAEIFAENGCHLFLGARRVDRLQELTQLLLAKGAASVKIHHLDVRSSASVTSWAQACLCVHDTIDVLVNNAGLVLGLDPIETGSEEDWQTIMDTNVMGVLRLTQAFLPKLKQQNRGHIVMIGSIAGHQAYEGGSAYCASKFGVKAITRTLKLELNGTGIRIGSIDPGMVETEFSVVRFKGDLDRAKNVYKGLEPLKARDIAECVYFMCDRPSHVNLDEIIIMPTAQATVYKTHRT
jgi:NADP-dependent 3-hydroxy acid dehydrogenase YdfG